MACFATPYGLRYAAHCFNRAHAQNNRPARISAGGNQGVTSITPQAMALRGEDQGGLSVTWVEHFGKYGQSSKRSAAIAYREALRTKHIGGEAVFATAQVKFIVNAGQSYGKSVRVVHDPVEGNPGHAEVRRFTDDDIRLLDHLATEIFVVIDKVVDLNLPGAPKS